MRIRQLARVLAAGLVVGGCSHEVREVAPAAWLVNKSAGVITDVRYRACGDSDDSWQPLYSEPQHITGSRELELPLDCVDLQALYRNGRIAGTQSGIKRRYPLRWIVY